MASAQESQDQVLSTKKDLLAPEGQRAGNKRQRQDSEGKGEEKGNMEKGEGVLISGVWG